MQLLHENKSLEMEVSACARLLPDQSKFGEHGRPVSSGNHSIGQHFVNIKPDLVFVYIGQ
jgi:hypothetical protein